VLPSALRDALADRYHLERELGAGGMATVYLAHDTRHDRPVAVKVLRAEHGLALGLGRAGQQMEAREMTARAIDGGIPPLYEAMIHAAAGDVDKALTALERGLRERGDWMYTIGVQPWFRVLHGHPRFVALLDAIRRGGPPLS
jgi:serine/threonine protein kinase